MSMKTDIERLAELKAQLEKGNNRVCVSITFNDKNNMAEDLRHFADYLDAECEGGANIDEHNSVHTDDYSVNFEI